MLHRRLRRSAHSPHGWRPQPTEEQIQIAKKWEAYLSDRAERKWRQARERFKLIRNYVLLGLSVISTIVLWVILFENPHTVPIGLGSSGAVGALAAILGYQHGNKSDKDPPDD